MERQQEYELRKKIADAIQNDVDRVFSEKLQLFNHDFYYEILFPLIVLALGRQIGLSRDSVMSYIDYFSMDVNVTSGNFTEFPLLKFKNKIIWTPSSIVLNDFQFSIVNGHYYKETLMDAGGYAHEQLQ